MTKIGFIGLGNMGAKMTINLLKADYEVIGYDINKEFVNNLLPKGLKQANNLSDIAKGADIVITMLPNGDIVEEVYDNIIDKFTPGSLFVDCSTIEVEKAKELHKKCKDKKILSLDAPVSGGVGGAEQATLTFMVGGTENAYKMMLPLFEKMGKKSLLIHYMKCLDHSSAVTMLHCSGIAQPNL